MFSLYHDKAKHELVIRPANKNQMMVARIAKSEDEVKYYNDCYFVCKNRTVLRAFANEMKNTWITELEEDLKAIKQMKITTKY